MEDLKITIIPEDFRNAPRGYENISLFKGCVLWQALKRLYPQEVAIEVGYKKAYIGGKGYFIPVERTWGLDPSDYPAKLITELSQRAKESLEGIPTVELVLTPIP